MQLSLYLQETPSPAVDADLRKAMSGAAVELCRKLGYEGAGTAEFILVSCCPNMPINITANTNNFRLGRKNEKVLLFGIEHPFASGTPGD